MDAFFASVDQLTRPTLRGRPVLVGGVSGRGVVAGCSYEARQYGVHSAMPMMQAKRLVPSNAVFVGVRHGLYGPVSKRVFSIVRDQVAVVEQLSVDEAFLEPEELRGATAAEVHEWAERLRAKIKEEVGITTSIGAGPGKQFAKIGSGLAKPDGVCVIPPDKRHEVLDPLPVGKLWGVGPVSRQKLANLGVNTIADFAHMKLADVESALGKKNGPFLWQLAKGIDPRPVKERDIAKSISKEYTYPADLTSVGQVHQAIDRALDRAHPRLLKDGRGAKTVTVKIRLHDLSIHTRSETLSYATQDKEVFAAVAHRLAFDPAQVGPIRLVGVGLSGLDAHLQEVLFPELERAEVVTQDQQVTALPTVTTDSPWITSADVHHSDYGHGWVQGAGHGVVSVRFESRTTGPGVMRTMPEDEPQLRPCSAVCSLDWQDWFAADEDAVMDTPVLRYTGRHDREETNTTLTS